MLARDDSKLELSHHFPPPLHAGSAVVRTRCRRLLRPGPRFDSPAPLAQKLPVSPMACRGMNQHAMPALCVVFRNLSMVRWRRSANEAVSVRFVTVGLTGRR